MVAASQLPSIKPLVRLLFLGNPQTDRRAKNFLQLFLELGCQVEFIFAFPGKERIELEIPGVRTTQLLLSNSGGPRMFFEYARMLKKELRNLDPCDILFACELYSLGSAADSKLLRKAHLLIYDARELYTGLPSIASNAAKRWYWKRKERKGLAQTDLVIVTAPDDADAIRSVHNFLPSSILVRNLPKKEPYVRNNYLREHFQIAAEKKIFVYVGGLQKDRGLEKMISQMSTLNQRAAFVLIGTGELLANLHDMSIKLGLKGAVFFHPPIDSGKVISVLGSADVGVSLIEANSESYKLALPSKIFEYMLAGLPVVSSPLKQVKDLFDDSEGVLFADPADALQRQRVCERALELSNDEGLRYRIHQKVSDMYTFEIDAKPLQALLQERLASIGSTPKS